MVLVTPMWTPASLVREGEHTAPVQDGYHCMPSRESARENKYACNFWNPYNEAVKFVCLSLIFQHTEPAYSQHCPTLKHQVAILQAPCVHPLQKLRKICVSNASYCPVSFHLSGTHLRLSHRKSITLKKVLLELTFLSKETQLPPHFQISFKSSHYSMQPERKRGTCSPKNARTMLFMVPRMPSGSYGIVDW